jgi:hypothetical protein
MMEVRFWGRLADEKIIRQRRAGNHCVLLEIANSANPKAKARLADLGGTALVGSPAGFGKYIADETEKWGNVIRALNIKAE